MDIEVQGKVIEDLYEEILSEIIQNVGNDKPLKDTEKIFTFLKEAFKVSSEIHDKCLGKAHEKEPRVLKLSIRIIEAEDLSPKDSNNLSDPFVILYMDTDPNTKLTSTVKFETLNPQFDETFSLSIPNNQNDIRLIVEMWDFDEQETVVGQMSKLSDVKSFRRFFKEIRHTTSAMKDKNEFIGSTEVPLRSIPAAGCFMQNELKKKGHSCGSVKMDINFTSDKDKKKSLDEHRLLLKILLKHELDTSSIRHNRTWSGKFNDLADTIITQHRAQSGLKDLDISIAQFNAFTEINKEFPLSFELFEYLTERIVKSITLKTDMIDDEEHSLFWDSVKCLLPSCYNVILKLHENISDETKISTNLEKALNIISNLSLLKIPDNKSLFDELQLECLKIDWKKSTNIKSAVDHVITASATDYFDSTIKISLFNDVTVNNELRIQQLIDTTQLIEADVQKAFKFYDLTFMKLLRIQYARTIYKIYDQKLIRLVKPIVDEISKVRAKIVDLKSKETEIYTKLFELYFILKSFTALRLKLCLESKSELGSCHEWFLSGVANWLQLSSNKAQMKIQKAIELDTLKSEDETIKCSSSAIDTIAVLCQIKTFWQQLNWPDTDQAFGFSLKLGYDICKCFGLFGDEMAKRVAMLGISNEWCLAINNIEYISKNMQLLLNEIGINDSHKNYPGVLTALIEDTADIKGRKIQKLIEILVETMSPTLQRFLNECFISAKIEFDALKADSLMSYLDESLKILNQQLSEEYFEVVLEAIWNEILRIKFELIQNSFKKQYPPTFYENLRNTLQMMITNFKGQHYDQSKYKKKIEELDEILELNSYKTTELIHKYYKDQYSIQKVTDKNPYGTITVKCFFNTDKLEIDIMNAKNLISMDKNGLCDPYVRIHFYPSDKFLDIKPMKTKVQPKSLFAIFDEQFTINVSSEQRNMKDAIVLFNVMDSDFGKPDEFVGEASLMFQDIIDITTNTENVKPLSLVLTRPENEDVELINTLKRRAGDKQAKELLVKFNCKNSEKKIS